jgi:hypothetical protein
MKDKLPHGRPEFFIPEEHPELAALIALPFIPFMWGFYALKWVLKGFKS